MTAMPQMVALFNGVGGGAAALVVARRVPQHRAPQPGRLHGDVSLAIVLAVLIGSVSFAGSMVAFAKLQELIQGRPITYPGQQVVNLALFAAIVAAGIAIVAGAEQQWLLVLIVLGSLVFGVLFVLPIGGADMPVVISLLNAFTGLAAAATGFELGSNVLIVSGALVGASGTLLTMMMGRAMNRSIGNVLFGAFGKVQAGAGSAAALEGTVRSVTVEDVAIMLSYARKVVVVPGLRHGGRAGAARGARARRRAREEGRRGRVRDPSGRGPHAGPHERAARRGERAVHGAEGDGRDQPASSRRRTSSLVIGANDVVNPAARNEPGSPIYGMPILNVDQANQIVVMKRSMATGFAGIDNPLFLDPKTAMLFGDAKESVAQARRRRQGALTRASRSSARGTSSSPCRRREAVEAVRDGVRRPHRGEWTMPPKVYVTNYPAGDFRAMPALGGGHALLKWVTSFPGNPARGLPTVSGLVLLSNAETGGSRRCSTRRAVTALRTGAAAVLAAETLGRPTLRPRR